MAFTTPRPTHFPGTLRHIMRAFLRGKTRTPFTYAAACALVALASLVSQYLSPGTFPYVPLLMCLVAVAGSGALGGHGPALLAGCLSLVSVDYLFIEPALTFKLRYATAHTIALSAFAAAAGLIAYVARSTLRVRLERARAYAAAARARIDNRHREALLNFSARSLSGGSLDATCRDAVTLTVQALGVDHCAIFELTHDDAPVVITSAVGWDAETLHGLTIGADADTHTG